METGRQRAAALEQAKAPWTRQTGLVVRGYRSKIDDSVQPYGLVIPESFDFNSPARLDIWYHGRGNTLSELKFIDQRENDVGKLVTDQAIVLHPFGRYCNANKFAGEVDTFEALEHVQDHYPIHPNRVTVRGFSMGGAATWHMATHHAGRWSAVDASTIDLCLSMFPWATFRRTKAAIKLHTQIDLKGSIPVFMSITDGSVHDVHFLDQIRIEAGSIYVFDRGYIDFKRLYAIHKARAFFVIRAKSNTRFYVRKSPSVDKSTGLRCDQTIRLNTDKAKRDYPAYLRRISFVDPLTNKRLVFLTNHFELPALAVAAIYKSRWQIELFFKWIKQNLRIKAFYGTSENAVRTQIWIAICVYLKVACLNKLHGINESMSRILQVLSVNVFQKEPIYQLLRNNDTRDIQNDISKQLVFNNL